MDSLPYVHPSYLKFYTKWEVLQDFYDGEDAVKQKGTQYLPATEGMILDGMNNVTDIGWKNYQSYKNRAMFPEYVREAVEALVGLMHQKEAIIELPPELEYLREKASPEGEPLLALYRRVTVEQVLKGRLGLLADLPKNPGNKPQAYIALYCAADILNWDNDWQSADRENLDLGLKMVLLDESGPVRDGMFAWCEQNQYRVLLMDSEYRCAVTENIGGDVPEDEFTTPSIQGHGFDSIPFVFINSKDLLPDIDTPPLMGLAQSCRAIYLGEADYRQNLYMQSQETLVVTGGVRNPEGQPGEPEAIRTGAGSRIDVDMQGDAKYIGPSSNGLSEQRLALEADRKRAEIKSGQVIQNNGSQMESGSALTTRFNAQSATLNQIVATSAAGMQKILQHIAQLHKADPSKCKVTPNLEFIDFALDGQNFQQLMTARSMGLPLSLQSLHETLADRGLTKLDFDTEMSRIEQENTKYKNLLPQAAAPGAAQPTTPPSNVGGE